MGTDNLSFVGREKIKVEYDQGTHVLDHWAFGPHHVWSYPENGQILRMWQPFNGLQVMPAGTPQGGDVDPELFSEIPPPECKKGGALFRIKCDDDGYPVVKDNKPSNTVSVNDIARANNPVPRPEYRGENFGHMSDTLNNVLMRNKFINTRPCEEWGLEEIQGLQRRLYLLREDSFDDIYHINEDKRRLSKTTAGDLVDLEVHWQEVNDHLSTSEYQDDAESILRDGHCHEAVMWYVHHIT